MLMTKHILAFTVVAVGSLPAFAQNDTIAAVNNLSEIVVTGSNRAVEARLLPYTVSVIDRDALDNSGSNELLNVLSSRVPSLFVTRRGILGFGVSSNGGSGHIKLRGVGGDRASAVLMMVDGQPQFAGLYSHHVADFYSVETVDRVEVLRGPASVLYGSNAMAGTINVITRDAPHKPYSASITSSYGSYNTSQTTAQASLRRHRLSALLSASYDRTDGHVDNFDFSQWSGYAKTSYRFSDSWVTSADLTLMNFKAHDPLYPRIADPESTDVYYQNITRGETSICASNNYATTSGVARVYYNWGNHYVDDPRHFHSTDDRLGILAYQNISPWRESDITVGFDFARYSGAIPTSGGVNHTPGAMATMERRFISEYSPYLTMAQSLANQRLTLNAGLRIAMSSRFSTRAVPQFGIVVNPMSTLTVKASAATGYRNPSFRELYLYRMANPDLQPERMWNYEVSVAKRFASIASVDLTFYFSQGSNIIQTVDMKNQNTGSFINKGIEASLHATPTNTLTINATYSYLHSSLSNLTGAPRHQYFIGADWRPMRRLTLSPNFSGVARLYAGTGIPLQSYALLNLKASYQLLAPLRLFVNFDNITDARYTINRGYPMPGFTACGGFTLNI